VFHVGQMVFYEAHSGVEHPMMHRLTGAFELLAGGNGQLYGGVCSAGSGAGSRLAGVADSSASSLRRR
jgi:hypothetical protein